MAGSWSLRLFWGMVATVLILIPAPASAQAPPCEPGEMPFADTPGADL